MGSGLGRVIAVRFLMNLINAARNVLDQLDRGGMFSMKTHWPWRSPTANGIDPVIPDRAQVTPYSLSTWVSLLSKNTRPAPLSNRTNRSKYALANSGSLDLGIITETT